MSLCEWFRSRGVYADYDDGFGMVKAGPVYAAIDPNHGLVTVYVRSWVVAAALYWQGSAETEAKFSLRVRKRRAGGSDNA